MDKRAQAYFPDMEKLRNAPFTFSLVIETENLGMAGIEDLEDTLISLQKQTFALSHAKEVIIIVAGHMQSDTLAMLHAKYPWLVIHEEAEKLEYTQSKMCGAKAATSDIVIFADSDVIYDDSWLENILYGFIAVPKASVIAGETRIRIHSAYTLAIQLSWMLKLHRQVSFPQETKDFHLNNFAIRRETMLNAPFFSGPPIYRGLVARWRERLISEGYVIIRVPYARGYHAPPSNFWDWWYRMLIFGADSIVKADFYFNSDGTITEKFSPLRRMKGIPSFAVFVMKNIVTRSSLLIKENRHNLRYMILGLPLAFLFLGIMMLGSVIALFDRDYVFKKITALENQHVV